LQAGGRSRGLIVILIVIAHRIRQTMADNGGRGTHVELIGTAGLPLHLKRLGVKGSRVQISPARQTSTGTFLLHRETFDSRRSAVPAQERIVGPRLAHISARETIRSPRGQDTDRRRPFTKHDLAGHPAWLASIAVLRYARVRLIDANPAQSVMPSRSNQEPVRP